MYLSEHSDTELEPDNVEPTSYQWDQILDMKKEMPKKEFTILLNNSIGRTDLSNLTIGEASVIILSYMELNGEGSHNG